jgi:single-strand DNA-binding protein
MPVSEFGRIGRDAELRTIKSGDAVCSVPVAVDYGRKGQDGKKPTQWYEVTLWGKQAEALAPYLLKGKQVFFTGTDLHVESFSKADGSQGTKLVCRAGEIKFASDGQQQAAPQQRQQPQRQAPRQSQQAAPPDDFGDIPFAPLHHMHAF